MCFIATSIQLEFHVNACESGRKMDYCISILKDDLKLRDRIKNILLVMYVFILFPKKHLNEITIFVYICVVCLQQLQPKENK